METPNNNPQESQPAPAASAPAPTPAPAPAPVASAPAPAPAPTGMAPQTKGNVSGGWNRFAGYKPGQQKDKKNDRRDQRGRR